MSIRRLLLGTVEHALADVLPGDSAFLVEDENGRQGDVVVVVVDARVP